MIAVDTNILVYSHRRDVAPHAAAKAVVVELAEGTLPWAIPWQCVHEFFGVATNRRLWPAPSTAREALEQIEFWMASPSLILLAETPKHWPTLQDVVGNADVTGPRVHDARIAAICIQHGVSVLWSADRDFSRFPGLKVVNPLVTR